jgi:hypothetical protein
MRGRGGRKPAARSNKRKGQGRKKEKKKGGGGLDMTGAHISRFSMVIRRMRARSSGAIGRRPSLPVRRERRCQYARQPCRCHRSTVSGFTMRREVLHSLNHRHARTQKRQSVSSRPGRAYGAARPTAVVGGKDYLRSAAPLGGPPQQSPTGDSETFTSPAVWDGHRLIVNVVNEKPCRLEFCALQPPTRASYPAIVQASVAVAAACAVRPLCIALLLHRSLHFVCGTCV